MDEFELAQRGYKPTVHSDKADSRKAYSVGQNRRQTNIPLVPTSWTWMDIVATCATICRSGHLDALQDMPHM